MKHLDIPYIPQLDTLDDTARILSTLDAGAPTTTIDSLNWASAYPYKPLTTFTAAHSGTALYIDFFVRCNYLRAENEAEQSPVSQDSCVEFFVQPDPSSPRYWNFEFNCIGAINASNRIERKNPTRLSHEELVKVLRYASCGNRPFREVEGIFNWNLLVVIPLDLIGIKYEGKPIDMRANFYKCASAASQPHYLSWNPIETDKPDFHRPEFFGEITLL